MARRICNGDSDEDFAEALRYQDEDFPGFDLTVLTPKQLDVLVMRYRGMLSWRKIAAFEGVTQYAIRCRHDQAMTKLRDQILHISRKGRGTRCISRSATVAAPAANRTSGVAHAGAEGGGSGITQVCWEDLYEQEAEAEEEGEGTDPCGTETPRHHREPAGDDEA
jgi:hypothetical protein